MTIALPRPVQSACQRHDRLASHELIDGRLGRITTGVVAVGVLEPRPRPTRSHLVILDFDSHFGIVATVEELLLDLSLLALRVVTENLEKIVLEHFVICYSSHCLFPT